MIQKEATSAVFDDAYANSLNIRMKRWKIAGRILLAACLVPYLLRLPPIYRHDPQGFTFVLDTFLVFVGLPILLALILFSKWPVLSSLFAVCMLTYSQITHTYGWHSLLLFAAIISLPIIATFLAIRITQTRRRIARLR